MVEFLTTFARSLARLRISEAALERRKLKKLKAIVGFVHERVPLYRELFGPVVPGIRQLSDLKNLPILDPAFLKDQNLSDITPTGAETEKLVLHGTSGTSGTPFRFYQSKRDVNAWLAATLRFFLLSGWRPWWTTAVVWREDFTKKTSLVQRLIERLKRPVSIHWPLEEQAAALRSHRPKMIYGISSALDVLASWMIENGQTLGSVRLVVGMGEAISPGMSARFEAAFGHGGLNYYGANECGLLGWECRFCGAYHFDEDSVVVEVVDEYLNEVGPGEQGRILVTTLDRNVTPLIRYDIGDLVTLSSDSARKCRIPFKQFAGVEGRVVDRLTLEGGREMSWHSVYALTTVIECVRKIQFGQRKDGEVIIRYVPREGFSPAEIEGEILGKLAITKDASIVFESCSEIPLEESGKFKLIKREA